MVQVERRSGESDQQLMRRFKRAVSKASIMSEVRRRRWFVPRSEQRRLAKKKALRRIRKKQKNRSF